jgi:hypothetical protein
LEEIPTIENNIPTNIFKGGVMKLFLQIFFLCFIITEISFAQCEPSFSNILTFPKTNGYDLGEADVDGDGDIDILSTYQNGLAVYKNDGTGNFTLHQVVNIGYHTVWIDTGDIDGDNHIDAILTNGSNPDYVWIFKNDGNGNFTNTANYGIGDLTGEVHTGDIDGDGDLDFILGNYGITVYYNDGSGNFPSSVSYPATMPNYSQLIDIDNDGNSDFVFIDTYPTRITVMQNDGTGNLTQVASYPIPSNDPWHLRSGDFNSDGYIDLVVTADPGNLYIYLNNGGQFSNSSSFTFNHGGYIGIGDIDHDNDSDILFAERVTYQIHALINDGEANFITQPLIALENDIQRIKFAHLNNDQKIDLIAFGGY